MTQHWPQYTYIALVVLKVVLNGILQGKETKVTYNPWTTLMGSSVAVVVLYFGGFFSPIGFAP